MSINVSSKLKGLLRKLQKKQKPKERSPHQKAIERLMKLAEPPLLFLTDLDKIKLPAFIECLVNDDYSGIIISGNPTQAEAAAAWQKIYAEYVERVGGVSVSSVLNREKEIMQICSRYDRVMMLVYIARTMFTCAEIAEALYAEGFMFDPNAEDEIREAQLKRIEAKMKPELLRLNKLAGAKQQHEQKSKNQKQSWKDFNELLARMSSAEGFQLRAENLNVGEFCAYLTRHRERVERMNKPTFQSR